MQSEAYQKIGGQTFRICAGCAGVPLLSIKYGYEIDELCDECKYERAKLVIKKWTAQRELDKFPTDPRVRKGLSFERRVRIANLITQLKLLNERKSENGYKAEKSLNHKKLGRGKQKTFRAETCISQNEQAGIGTQSQAYGT